MKNIDPAVYGAPNPNAPHELQTFAFLIGTWEGEGRTVGQDGTSQDYRMTWVGRYILGGYAIADEARVFDAEGMLSAHFITYRFYDREAGQWIIEAFNVLESSMIHQAPEDLGGVRVSGETVSLMTRWPTAIGRESFVQRTGDHFTFRMDVSMDDGETWMEGMDKIEARRVLG